MRKPPYVLIVDDNPANLDILGTRLDAEGYEVATATDGEQALTLARAERPDLILLDIMMPRVDGITVCRELKSDDSLPFIPIIMVTAKADSGDIVAGLEAGADEYLTKPIDQKALVARVKSMLRMKALSDQVQEKNEQLVEWNRSLEQRVARQLDELERIGRLRQFFSPQIADVIVSQGGDDLLRSHRREITVVFCDLRGFTAFSEIADPEEVTAVLQDYHGKLGEIAFEYEATIERYVGDSIMVWLNDPLPCEDHELHAAHMALAMRESAHELCSVWRRRGHDLGVGFGIATGYATLGKIGFEKRFEYSATGPVANLAARLCEAARDGQILINQRVYAAIENAVKVESLGDIHLKGLHDSVCTYNLRALNGL